MRLVVGLALAAVLIAAPLAAAKEFPPGPVQVCVPADCVWVNGVLPTLGEFLYGGSRVRPAARPAEGKPLRLRFADGGLLGVLAPAGAPSSFRSSGGTINEGRIDAGRWYELPGSLAVAFSRAAGELKRLSASEVDVAPAESPVAPASFAAPDDSRPALHAASSTAASPPQGSSPKPPVLAAALAGGASALLAAVWWRLRGSGARTR